MSTVKEISFTVDSRDVDLTGCCRPSALLGYLQEAATLGAMGLGMSAPEAMEKYHCIWMLIRMWVRLDRPIAWNETVTVRTWHRGGKGVSSYRDFDLSVNGETVGEAVSVWVLADGDTRRLLRLGTVPEFQGTDGGELCKSVMLHRVKMPEELSAREERPMRYSDTDINGHVSNIKYADFACDALHLEERMEGKYIAEFQLGYLAECRAGETITVESASDGGALYARGAGAGGDERFDCMLRLEERNL